MKSSRLLHYISLCVMLIALVYTIAALPELWTGKVTTFATIGSFVTFYGVLFAVIETSRARAASDLAQQAATDANKKVVALYTVKNIAECQTCIRNTLQDLEKDGWASTATLSRILELYTAEFHEAYGNPSSEERASIASLQSHAASASGPLAGRTLTRLKDTLVKMLTDLTAAASGKITETPQ